MPEDQQEPVVVVIQTPTPTTKQQLTSAAIQVGAALVLPAVFAAGLATVGAVAKAKEKLAARKLSKTPVIVVPSDPEE